MLNISILDRKAKKATFSIWFRIKDGGRTPIDIKSNITTSRERLDKLDKFGYPKARVIVYDINLSQQIIGFINLLKETYQSLLELCPNPTSKALRYALESQNKDKVSCVKDRNSFCLLFEKYIDDRLKDNLIVESRAKMYRTTLRYVRRFFMVMYKIKDMNVDKFTTDVLCEFRRFYIDEYKYVDMYPDIYSLESPRDIPSEERNHNTASSRLAQLKAFFNELECKDIIVKSPFRKLDKQRKTEFMKQTYEQPICLSLDELLQIRKTDVPETLKDTKNAFLLQCALGCRISDFVTLSMNNIGVENGIPYVSYIPQKTKRVSFIEVKTPLVRFAFDIVKEYSFSFDILRNRSGQDGYSKRLKDLLQLCNINRKVKSEGKYKPLYETASTKLGRKTLTNITVKYQLNPYTTGLHKEGSDAVQRYISEMTIYERFCMLSAAFNEEQYRVDDNLNIISYK